MREKVYEINDSIIDEEIKRIFNPFFNDICARKRGKLFTNDLRSIIVVFKDKAYAQVCDRNGYASHTHASINLVRRYNNDDNYFYEEDQNNPFCYKSDQKQVREETISFKFSTDNTELLLDIGIPKDKNMFQLRMFSLIIKMVQYLKKNNKFSRFTVNLWSGNEHLIYSSSSEEKDIIDNVDFDNKLIGEATKEGNNYK